MRDTSRRSVQNLFEPGVAEGLAARISHLRPAHEAGWDSMTVSQMLAPCCVPFETVYDPDYARKHPRPNAVVRTLMRVFVKHIVVGEKPYKRNMRTAPEFVIDGEPDFATEQARLSEYVQRVAADGAAAFDGREAHSFDPLTAKEWSTLLYKHTDHHLTQFGV